jgi:hypothetical protein
MLVMQVLKVAQDITESSSSLLPSMVCPGYSNIAWCMMLYRLGCLMKSML